MPDSMTNGFHCFTVLKQVKKARRLWKEKKGAQKQLSIQLFASMMIKSTVFKETQQVSAISNTL